MKTKLFRNIKLPPLWGGLGWGLSLLLLALPAGCELEQVDYGKIETSNFPKTEEDVQTMLNYMYHHFTRDFDGIFNHYAIMPEYVTDIGEGAWGAGQEAYIYNYYEANNSLYHAGPSSASPYEYLPLLSTLILDIERMNTVEFDETRRARYLAELQCGMGWLAFILYDFYGPVPLPTLDILKDPLRGGGTILERASDEEMRKFIETNLKEAAAVLPYDIHAKAENKYSSDDYGRFHKGLANFVLMKFYMLVGRYVDAEAMGRELIKPEYGYRLMPKYSDLFTSTNEKNAEIIYSDVQAAGSNNNWCSATMPSDYDFEGRNITGWGGVRMSWYFYSTFEEDDERKNRIIAEYTAIDADHTVHNKANDKDGGKHGIMYHGPFPVKYDWRNGATGTYSDFDWVVYRYADVVTLLAEAIVRNDGDRNEALGLLNQVRTRAGLAARRMDEVNTPERFLDKLLEERGHEFWFEGVRRQDLIRHGRLIEFAIKKIEEDQIYPSADHLKSYAGAAKYGNKFAIPQYYIIQSKGYIQQNPGF
jgi:hypothetical protein